MASELYKNIKVNSDLAPPNPTTTNRAYKGLSTVNPENVSKTLYDIGLIKQDLLNHFHIRQGEKLMWMSKEIEDLVVKVVLGEETIEEEDE